VIPAAISFLAAALLTPVVRILCTRRRLFDSPGPLKIHSRPTPRLGGVAVVLAILAGISVAGLGAAQSAWPLLLGLAMIWSVGVVDDLCGLSPFLRLAAQLAAATVLWEFGGRFPILGGGAPSVAATWLFVLALTNSINLLDGLDGLATGVVGIIAAAYLALPGAIGDPLAFAVAGSVAGACAAFLLSNFPPASIFLGDTGSTALGFSLAWLGLELIRSHPASRTALAFPLLTAAVPLLDTCFAVIRRLNGRSSPLCGDRSHFYDLLRPRGWTTRRISLTAYAITTALGAISLAGTRNDSAPFRVAATLTIATLVYVGVQLGSLRREDQDRTTQNAGFLRNDRKSGQPSSAD
jgi:UDP-GlcNAc:undecaprenyl-phosphate/decaprenyl-phosphate GlcNAc-1-phosphate transferase